MLEDGRKRIIIENIKPQIDCGRFPIKRVVGEKVTVRADIFADGHEDVVAMLQYRSAAEKEWREVPMKFLNNDRWEAEFTVEKIGVYYYTIQGWIDHFSTWQKDLQKKFEAGQNVKVELLMGAEFIAKAAQKAKDREDIQNLRSVIKILESPSKMEDAVAKATGSDITKLMGKYPEKSWAYTAPQQLEVMVERKKALFSTWYEIFPRSFGAHGKHGTFKDIEKMLPEIAKMGFDVIYFPPIHPIGIKHRKGKNNSTESTADDPGSPWAIGGKEGGHKAVHPQLGTLADFRRLTKKAKEFKIDIAIDLAYQCSPDHPYVKEHPEWFRWRPDGTIQYAENPPKKYQDVLPINFETEKWKELWEELKSVVLFWIDKGVQIFRVDNPHTKAFPFWEWLIKGIKKDFPEVIFLSEAFTRPKVMYRLGKVGFTQSYTYFTWRNTKQEFTDYLTELATTQVSEFFRPNFWPNTPDILPQHLQFGGRPAFKSRLILAATLSSNYGMYAPAFELCINNGIEGKEEYVDSEKYEIKNWDLESESSIRDLIVRVNWIRHENIALQSTRNIKFYEIDNSYILFYGKFSDDMESIMLVLVNLDPFHTQSGWVKVPIKELEIDPSQPFLVHDLLSDEKYIWQGERNYVSLDPQKIPAHIFRVHKRLRREQDFDYFL